MIHVAIIGCGNIGTELAYFIDKDKRFVLKSVTDINPDNINSLLSKIKSHPRIVSIHQAIQSADLIIEAANKNVVNELLKSKDIDKPNKKLMIMSTGGLIKNLIALNKLKFLEVHIPSGAIAGLDAIKSCAGKIKSLEIKTTKPAVSLQNTPFVKKNKIAIDNVSRKKKIFDGNFKEAVKGFPQNINVAASIFLASKFHKIRVQIYVDPGTKFNTHEILCKGDFGTILTLTQNRPSKNPKTSYLAILSGIGTVKSIADKIKIGS